MATGSYGNWTSLDTGKAITVRCAEKPCKFTGINAASYVTYDGIEIDNQFAIEPAFFADGRGLTFKNGSIHGVIDEKASMVIAADVTFDNVDIYDVRQVASGVHNECIWSSGPSLTIRNSRFRNCATFDVFFSGSGYGGVTLEDNRFGFSVMPDGTPHYVAIGVHDNLGTLTNWTVRRNFIENGVNLNTVTIGSGNVFCSNTGDVFASWKTACP